MRARSPWVWERRERAWRSCGERYSACSSAWLVWWWVKEVWGGISMEGHTDLFRLKGSTLTAVSYQVLGLSDPMLVQCSCGFLVVFHNVLRKCRQFLLQGRSHRTPHFDGWWVSLNSALCRLIIFISISQCGIIIHHAVFISRNISTVFSLPLRSDVCFQSVPFIFIYFFEQCIK